MAESTHLKIDTLLTKPFSATSLFNAMMKTSGYIVENDFKGKGQNETWEYHKKRLQGVNVLLVEDNLINQELANELLTSNGINTQVANNGVEALELLKYENFDCVLMDCQMPVMDGYETTRQIRLNKKWESLPILAMTANAMTGDREKVLAVGMNDHISKPIDINKLFSSMSRWIKPMQDSKPIEDDMVTTETETKSDSLNTQVGLANCQNNEKLYWKLLIKLYHQEKEFVNTFKATFESDNDLTTSQYAHTLKGVSGTLGALQVQCLVEELEVMCQSETLIFEDVAQQVTAIDEALKALWLEINQYTENALFS